MISSMRLQFNVSDISYLIVDTETDVHDLIHFINHRYSQEPQSVKDMLFTKILSHEQLLKDL